MSDLSQELGVAMPRLEMLHTRGGTYSLDAATEEGMALLEAVADELAPNADDLAAHRQSLLRLRGAVQTVLNERERLILIRHYDLDGAGERPMADIGRTLDISRERVRQIERDALVRLRAAM